MTEQHAPTRAHAQSSPTHHRVAIIGSGFAGIGMAARLKRAGVHDLVLLEKSNDLGGTWRDNTFPGATCDVPSHLYSLSFAPNPHWSQSFSPQPEIWDYLRRVAVHEDVVRHVEFGREVRSAHWEPEANHWRVETSRGTLTAQFLVSGCGALFEPSTPALPGLGSFEGAVFHSARWRHDRDLTGRTVAVVGTGASAIQFVPQIQPQVARMHLYQRTPAWVVPRPQRRLSAAESWLYRTIPLTQRIARTGVYWWRESYVLAFVYQPKLMKGVAALSKAHMRRHVTDPQLRAKLTPHYRPGCKRLLLANDYYPALARPNVDVITDDIAEVREKSIVTANGTERECDTIIFGTGFHVTDLPVAQRIHNAEGDSLADIQGDDLEAHRGTTVNGFPNLFILAGPNTGPGHTSQVFFIESQIKYAVAALRYAHHNGVDRLEPRAEAQAAHTRRVRRKMRRTVWVTGGCDSWYLNSSGRNVTLWPGFSWEFALLTRRFDPHNYHLRGEVPTAPADPTRADAATSPPPEPGAEGDSRESGADDAEEEYSGPVTVRLGANEISADAHIAGHFDPLTGTYRWVGRLARNHQVTAAFQHGHTEATLHTPDGHAGTGTLSATNVWGGHAVSGSGMPPYPLPQVDPRV